MWVKHLIDRVLAEEFAAPDLEFAWDADSDADPSATATIATDYVKTGIKSINEVRAEPLPSRSDSLNAGDTA